MSKINLKSTTNVAESQTTIVYSIILEEEIVRYFHCACSSYPQVHAATGRCTEYRAVWALFNFTDHIMHVCLFCSCGKV